ARGRLENPLLLPGDDASLDSIGFAKARPVLARRDEIDDDDDALLLDAERRDIRERHGLDRPHAPEEDVAASPALELDLRARLDTNGVGREDVDDDFKVAHVGDRQEGLAHDDRSTALSMDRDDAAIDRRKDRDGRGPIGAVTRRKR